MSEQEKPTTTTESPSTTPAPEVSPSEVVSANPTPHQTPDATPAASTSAGKKVGLYVAAGIVVIGMLLAALYFMEKEGRSNTDVFGWLLESQQANSVVATVNGVEITGSDLAASVEQFQQVAAAQGADVTSPDVQTSIREQALQVLINTKLLTQAAAESNITVTTEEAQTRLDEITTELGGPEVLEQRVTELGISEEKLLSDIQEEVVIERYLDQLFAETDISVSEEEVTAFYDQVAAEGAEVPPLDDAIRAQIEQQLTTEAEQAAIDARLSNLREAATIDIVE